MNTLLRLKENIVVVERSDGIFIGHLDSNILLADVSLRSVVRAMRNWISVQELLQNTDANPAHVQSVIRTLEAHDFLERRNSEISDRQIIISHLNEIGILISGQLSESGIDVDTLDSRLASLSDIRGQFVHIANVGESFQKILDAQKREIINSGNRASESRNQLLGSSMHSVDSGERLSSSVKNELKNKLVIMTTYPAPEMLAYLMSEGINHLILLATAKGVQIGPFVSPGLTPCFHCYELQRSDHDRQWSKVAGSLFAQRFAPISMARAFMISALVTPSIIANSFARTASYRNISFTQDQESAIWDFREENHIGQFHSECSCHWSRALSTRAL